MAMESQGAIVYLSTTTSLSTVKSLGGVVGWNGPNQVGGEIDITRLGSTAKEFMMGLYDSGSVSFDCLYITTDAGQIALRKILAARTKGHFAVKYPSPTTVVYQADYKGYCKSFGVSGKVDDKITAAVTIRISGGVNVATVAAP